MWRYFYSNYPQCECLNKSCKTNISIQLIERNVVWKIHMTRDTCRGWQDCVWSGTEDDREYFFDIYWQFVWEILFLFWLNSTKTPPWWDGRPHSWDTSQLVSVLHNKYYLFWTRSFLWAPRSGSPGRHQAPSLCSHCARHLHIILQTGGLVPCCRGAVTSLREVSQCLEKAAISD